MGRWLFALAVMSQLLVVSQQAFAKGKGCRPHHDVGFVSVEGTVGMLKLPQMAVNGDDTPRRLVGLPTASVLQPTLGGSLSLAVRCDWLVVDLLSIGYATTTANASLTSSADGGSATSSMGPLQILDMGLPLFGGFQLFPEDGWKVGLKVDLGMELVWGSVTVSGPSVAPTGGSLLSTSAYVRAQVSGCGRLGKPAKEISTSWVCLTVTPILYDGAPFPGVSFGLRVDL